MASGTEHPDAPAGSQLLGDADIQPVVRPAASGNGPPPPTLQSVGLVTRRVSEEEKDSIIPVLSRCPRHYSARSD